MKDKSPLRFIVALLIGGGICLAIIFIKGVLSAESPRQVMKILSDGFFVSGAVLFLSGAMLWIIGQGVFSGMGYAFSRIFTALHDKKYRDEHKESFEEYGERKSQKKPRFAYLLISGTCYLLPAIVFTALFYAV